MNVFLTVTQEFYRQVKAFQFALVNELELKCVAQPFEFEWSVRRGAGPWASGQTLADAVDLLKSKPDYMSGLDAPRCCD